MVKTVSAMLPMSDGDIDIESWLNNLTAIFPPKGIKLIRHACVLAQLSSDEKNPAAKSAIQQALEIANRLLSMDLDYETIAAALVYGAAQNASLDLDDIQEHLGKRITRLVTGVIKMDAINIFQNQTSNQRQIETVREMLLTMVDDVRVVIIKLAERCCIMQAMEFRGTKEQRLTAEETHLIYAPLASRLGINEIKWELEDLAFRYLETDKYKALAKQVNEKRIVREAYVADFMANLSHLLNTQNVAHDVKGRAKHIYSIHKKMQRKEVSYNEVYDATAVRVLVENIDDCYTVLSVVHNQWQHVPEEFDDYIATPKPNGYASIHTVAIGPGNKHVEIQIRTHEMHEKNELGVAAHWLYKEGSSQTAYDRKIAWLRELLAWEKELADASELPNHLKENLEADRVFVFTPTGDLISLPMGATPLDFAYAVHSDVGHRCKGAKVNDKMIPLTHKLQTGDRVEILTHKVSRPSRDWLNPHAGYVVSSRSKAKIHSWFKKQDQESNHQEGRILIDREFKKLGLRNVDLNKLSRRFHLKTADNLISAVGGGDVRMDQLLKFIEEDSQPDTIKYQHVIPIRTTILDTKLSTGIQVEGVGDLVTHLAGCCKPLPGDDILGYVTQGHDITIHHANCDNIKRQTEDNEQRVFEVSWGQKETTAYAVEIQIEALDRHGLLHDITMIISQMKIHLLDVNTHSDPKKHICRINIKLAINDIETLNQALTQINQLSNIYEVKRL